jgi:hypothetical protein
MYTTLEYYKTTYGGSDIPDNEFIKCEREARVFIDYITFNRLKEDITLITDDIQIAVCAVMDKSKEIENKGGIIASESVDKVSVTYVVNANSTLNSELLKVAKMYLPQELLYRGV